MFYDPSINGIENLEEPCVLDLTGGLNPPDESLLSRFVVNSMTMGNIDCLFGSETLTPSMDITSFMEGDNDELRCLVAPIDDDIRQGVTDIGKWLDYCRVEHPSDPQSLVIEGSPHWSNIEYCLSNCSSVVDKLEVKTCVQVSREGSYVNTYVAKAARAHLSEEYVLTDGTKTVYLYDSVRSLTEKRQDRFIFEGASRRLDFNLVQCLAHCIDSAVVVAPLHKVAQLRQELRGLGKYEGEGRARGVNYYSARLDNPFWRYQSGVALDPLDSR